jgi:secondary thiamine-phosphate synthase enzyme
MEAVVGQGGGENAKLPYRTRWAASPITPTGVDCRPPARLPAQRDRADHSPGSPLAANTGPHWSDNGKVKSFRKELWFEVPGRRAFLNITREVEDVLRESGVKEGLVLVNAMHITASVFINDDETGLHADYERWLEKLAPHEPTSQYRHNRTGEDNADAHMKRQVMGREVVVAITGGKLDFGPWEQIFYGEFDGGRRKRALIKIVGE